MSGILKKGYIKEGSYSMKTNGSSEFAGWISEKHQIAWVISEWRKDKRAGPIRSGLNELRTTNKRSRYHC